MIPVVWHVLPDNIRVSYVRRIPPSGWNPRVGAGRFPAPNHLPASRRTAPLIIAYVIMARSALAARRRESGRTSVCVTQAFGNTPFSMRQPPPRNRNYALSPLSVLYVDDSNPHNRAGSNPQFGSMPRGGQIMAAKESGRSSGRGFASMDAEKQREIARKGGKAVSRDRQHMAAIGRKGGVEVSKDRQHMAEIGRKGGEEVSQNTAHMAEIGRKGGEEISQNTAHMAEIGRKGGEASHNRHTAGRRIQDGAEETDATGTATGANMDAPADKPGN
jgi:general stress protein YciG